MSFPGVDLDSKQTRRLYLAGTVAFPQPFPCIGTISFEKGSLKESRKQQVQACDVNFVVAQGPQELQYAISHIVLSQHVSAIFFPGVFQSVPSKKDRFQFSQENSVTNFDLGEWFFAPSIDDPSQIAKDLGITLGEINTRDSIARGIMFVSEDRSVVTLKEITQTAGSICERSIGYCCECDTKYE